MSGGERQRISIARALLINPSILILDEATSSVDTTTEKEIQRALDNLVKGRTTIAIAHRLSTLRKADRLVVLDKGEVIEIGPHEALMDAQGAYYQLYQAQIRHATELVEGGAIGESLEVGAGEGALQNNVNTILDIDVDPSEGEGAHETPAKLIFDQSVMRR